jgi:hypothetical protein
LDHAKAGALWGIAAYAVFAIGYVVHESTTCGLGFIRWLSRSRTTNEHGTFTDGA